MPANPQQKSVLPLICLQLIRIHLATETQERFPSNILTISERLKISRWSLDRSLAKTTFSSLEQQVLTNDRLEQISTILGSQGLTQHAHWIGKKGLVDGPFDLNGSDAVLKFVIPPSAQTPKLIIQNGLGEIVFEKFMSPGDNEFILKAKDQTGIPLDNGPFTAKIIEADDAKITSISKVGSYHEIIEVQQINGTSYIHFENGEIRSPDKVEAIKG